MPTYIYETTDPRKPLRKFEVKQSVLDKEAGGKEIRGKTGRFVVWPADLQV